MKNTRLLTGIIPAVLCLWALASCTGRDGAATVKTPDTEPAQTSPWYYFSESGLRSVQNPAAIPFGGFSPWTEATRVTDCGFDDSRPVLLVNRFGLILSGSDGKPEIIEGGQWFQDRTAGALYKSEQGLSARLYRNSFFGDTTRKIPEREPFFTLVDTGAESVRDQFYPSDLGLDNSAQCVALDRIGSMWYASFKQETADRIDFTYLEFESFPLSDGAEASGTTSRPRRITADAYRASVKPFPIKDAVQPVRDIISALPPESALQLRYYSPLSPAVQIFSRPGSEPALQGTILHYDGKTALLFSDGTFYFSEEEREGIRALTLPKLSRGYVYGPFIIEGQRLLASWEEQRFFETGRAGLLEVNLADVL